MFERIPPASAKVLRELCHFHFLNRPQMVELGISKSVDSLGIHALPPLAPPRDKDGNEHVPKGKKRNSYLCFTYRYANSDPKERGTKQSYVYYLTPAGLDYAQWRFAEELENEDIWIPKERAELSNVFFHRRDYVSTHIYLRQWAKDAGAMIDFFTHDYQGDPSHRGQGRPTSINQVVCNDRRWKTATPDGLLGLTHQGKSRIFSLELHRRTPTTKVVEQIYRNFQSTEGIAATFPGYPTSNDPFMLSVFTEPHIMRASKKAVLEHDAFRLVLKGLLFASLDDLAQDFAQAWTYADNTPAMMFGG